MDRSYHVPVVVDFWAEWCAPCRTLGPLLERLVAEHGGALELAKVNIDQNPMLATAFSVQSIPMVIGLRNGEIVGQFLGAQSQTAVRDFLTRLLPSRPERMAEEGAVLLAAGQVEEAEALFRQVLAEDRHSDKALLGLATVLAGRDAHEDALALLDRVGGGPQRMAADRLAAAVRIRQSGSGDIDALRARLADSPDDLEARFALAQALAGAGFHEEALQHFLVIVRRDRRLHDDGARRAMVDIFDILGNSNDLTERFRGELAKALFR